MRNIILVLSSLAACAGADGPIAPPAPTAAPRIEQIASPAEGILANAYLIDTPEGVIVVDAALRVSDARGLRARVDQLGKPLLGVLITHGHPDHYNGVAILTAGRKVPVVATAEVDRTIRANDAAKEAQWKPVFGAEWPDHRSFPSTIVADGESVQLGGLEFRVHAVGPAESHADTYWTIDGAPNVAFVGDLVFSGTHSFLTDGHTARWLGVLAALERALPAGVTLYPGHGVPGGVELVAAQRRYLEGVRAAVARLSPSGEPLGPGARAELVAAMKRIEPTSALEFLIGLGADAVAAEVAAER